MRRVTIAMQAGTITKTMIVILTQQYPQQDSFMRISRVLHLSHNNGLKKFTSEKLSSNYIWNLFL